MNLFSNSDIAASSVNTERAPELAFNTEYFVSVFIANYLFLKGGLNLVQARTLPKPPSPRTLWSSKCVKSTHSRLYIGIE